MKVLVTGGAGFIGSHVVDRLLAEGHTARIIDIVRSPYHPSTEVEAFIGSVDHPEVVELAMTGCDAVIHLAAVADVADVHDDPVHAEHVNARGTLTILEEARRLGVQRVIYGSTIWVYSDCREDRVDETTHLAAPSHFYTATKLAGEAYCTGYAELYGQQYTILRFGIPYGPRARAAGVVPAMVNRALSGGPIVVAGDGSQSRRFVYVEDLAAGIVAALRPVAANRIYNLVGCEDTSILAVAQTVCEVCGDCEVVHGPSRPGDFGGKEVSAERARRELGWTASTPFEEGVRRYVAWRRQLSADGVAPAPAPRPSAPTRAADERAATAQGPRVLVLSGDTAERPDGPASALADEIAAGQPGAQVTVCNGVRALGRVVCGLIRGGSHIELRRRRWVYRAQYWLMADWTPTRWLTRRLLYRLGAGPLARTLRAHAPDVVISTHPAVTTVLGELRRRGRISLPAFAAITDLAGLSFSAHPGIDVHFVAHEESLEEVERIAGSGSARWTRPPTAAAYLIPRSRAAARRALDLPSDGRVIVVSGGGWGVGDLEGAVRVALTHDPAMVVCVCGRNERAQRRLTQRFAEDQRVRVLGFSEQMSDLLAAADALVHSSAGLTVLEARMRGCPVISYGFDAGHVRLNNIALKRFRLAEVAGSRAALDASLRRALARRPKPDHSFAVLPSPAAFVRDAREQLRPQPVLRARLGRIATAATAALAVGALAFSLDDPYQLLAKPFALRPVRSVPTTRPEVGLLIDAQPAVDPMLARMLAERGLHASFVMHAAPQQSLLAALRSAGDDALPALRTGEAWRWIGTKHYLSRMARDLGLPHHFLYVVPSQGFTLGQYVLGQLSGAQAIGAKVRFPDPRGAQLLRAGEVVELIVARPADLATEIPALVTALTHARVGAIPVSSLIKRT